MINGATKLTGLLGSPVSHSMSPAMHNEGFAELGLNYVYLCFDVSEEGLEEAVKGLKALGAAGWNCTMPDKNLMARLCDKLSPAAEIVGAVNTVVNNDGILCGYNTDGTGFMRSAYEQGFNASKGKVTVLGAGGAATSIFVQAALDGVPEISVFSRPGAFAQRAQNIIEKLAARTGCNIRLFDYSDPEILRREISESTMLVNGTNLGMAPMTDRCIIDDETMLHSSLLVADIIYNPRVTRLMRIAKERGCKTFNGLNMLLYQGAEAFRLWTGCDMPVENVKKKYFDSM